MNKDSSHIPVIDSKKTNKLQIVRFILFAPIIPIILGVGVWFYERAGRFINTENAYVKADIIQISSKVSGSVGQVRIKNDQAVKAGDLLFYLDKTRFEAALDVSEAELAAAKFGVDELKSNFRLLSLKQKEANERVKFNQLKYERQKKLSVKKIGPRANLEEARYNLEAAKQFSAGISEQRRKVLQNLKGDVNLKYYLHPSVRKAKAKASQKSIDLSHTQIFAPADGVIANFSLQVGEFVKAGKPIFSIVKQEDMWVEANLKETQLTYLKRGQTAEISVDAYPDLIWNSEVTTIGAATGAEFSLLPPQNASGNWVKVVQRLPIRLSLKKTSGRPNLRPGMSVKVTIDTKRIRSAITLAKEALGSIIPENSIQLQSIID